MIYAIVILVALVVTLMVLVIHLLTSQMRSYRYAVAAAAHYMRSDPRRASAYDDMATVITLDGKATPKWELNASG